MQVAARFISVEGGEGAGKSLFTQGLSRALLAKGVAHVLTREPGGTPLADGIRALFLDPPAGDRPLPLSELFLVSAARVQHLGLKIKPALAAGQWVICDRFYDSTRVYQGFLAGLERQMLESIIDYSVDGCHPHLTFVLDCPSEISMQRVAERSLKVGQEKATRFDAGTLAMHQQLRQGYLKLAEQYPERLKVLDASQSPEALLNSALHILHRYWSL